MRLIGHLLNGVATTLLLLPRLPHKERDFRIQLWCRQLLGILNVSVKEYGHIPHAPAHRTLFVANHVSWLDIWVLKQRHRLHFVAKSDIRDWPVIGWLADKTGTLFIERERRRDTHRTMQAIEHALLEEENLCVFPEGTTTDGTRLLPFKPSLFQAAINTGAAVQPVAIRYVMDNGSTNTAVAYCDNITMSESLRAVLRQRQIRVELHYAPPLSAEMQERRTLSDQARQSIACALHPKARRAPGTPAYPPAEPH